MIAPNQYFARLQSKANMEENVTFAPLPKSLETKQKKTRFVGTPVFERYFFFSAGP
jgi:hypothetical protein